jgi:type I restriction enzyme S subunit
VSGWPLVQLAEVVKIDRQTGKHSGLPYVGLEDIQAGTGRLSATLQPRTVKSQTFRFGLEHVLYGRLRPYLNKFALPTFAGHCSTEIFPLLPSPRLTREFLAYWLSSSRICNEINETCHGARMPRADMDEVLTFKIPLPPLDEQKRIVARLNGLQSQLENLRRVSIRQNEELRELESAKTEAALAAADDTDLLPLSTFASVDYGFTDSSSPSKSGPKFLRITDIQDGQVNWETVPRCEISEKELESKRLRSGDLVFARTGATTGKSYLIPEGIPETVAASYLIRVRANTEVVTPAFLAMYFRSARYWDAISAGTSGSAQGGFNASKLKQLQIPTPKSLETQKEILTELEAISSLVASKSSTSAKMTHSANALGDRILSSAFAGEL